jgi:hypothetical protein
VMLSESVQSSQCMCLAVLWWANLQYTAVVLNSST